MNQYNTPFIILLVIVPLNFEVQCDDITCTTQYHSVIIIMSMSMQCMSFVITNHKLKLMVINQLKFCKIVGVR